MKSRFIWIVVVLVILAAVLWFTTLKEDLNMAKAEEIAFQWVTDNSLTYVYDGFDLELIESEKIDNSGYRFEYSFTSRHGGYGDRSNRIVIQVLSDHNMSVRVVDGEVVSAITDQYFDEIKGMTLEQTL